MRFYVHINSKLLLNFFPINPLPQLHQIKRSIEFTRDRLQPPLVSNKNSKSSYYYVWWIWPYILELSYVRDDSSRDDMLTILSSKLKGSAQLLGTQTTLISRKRPDYPYTKFCGCHSWYWRNRKYLPRNRLENRIRSYYGNTCTSQRYHSTSGNWRYPSHATIAGAASTEFSLMCHAGEVLNAITKKEPTTGTSVQKYEPIVRNRSREINIAGFFAWRNEPSSVNYAANVRFGWCKSTRKPLKWWSDFDISNLDQFEEDRSLNDFLTAMLEMEDQDC